MTRRLAATEDQALIAEAAKKFVESRATLATLRNHRRTSGAVVPDRAVWREMASLGWLGILQEESAGGAGLGLVELGVILEQLGRTMTPTAFTSTVLLGAELLARAGDADQRARHLPAVIAGDELLALALSEGHGHVPELCETTAEPAPGGAWVISGEKRMVLDGALADTLIVIARTSGQGRQHAGRTAFLVDPQSGGVKVQPRVLLNRRQVADIRFEGVMLPDSSRLGEIGRAGEVLDNVLDRATAGACAEMLGGIQGAFEMTLDYLKVRHQFGVAIGSFQALQHRAAIWWCDIEMAKSVVMSALLALDEKTADAARTVSAAKALVSDLYLRSGAEAVQLHGGMGMTEEANAGLFVKEARVAATVLGDASFHRRRFARLSGY